MACQVTYTAHAQVKANGQRDLPCFPNRQIQPTAILINPGGL